MQVIKGVVGRVQINMVNNFSNLCFGKLSMFPLSAVPFSSISKAVINGRQGFMGLRSSLNAWIGRRIGWSEIGNWRNHFVAAPAMLTVRKAVLLFFVRIKWIAMALQHLVVPHTHLAGNNWTAAVRTFASNDATSPSVFGAPVFLYALEMHQAITMCCVFTPALVNGTLTIHFGWGHILPYFSTYKALGNSMAIPCVRWIGSRIETVSRILEVTACR